MMTLLVRSSTLVCLKSGQSLLCPPTLPIMLKFTWHCSFFQRGVFLMQKNNWSVVSIRQSRGGGRDRPLRFKMKTLCVVAAVLSLASLGHSASLACQNLTAPVQQGPDVGNFTIIVMMFGFFGLVALVFQKVMSLQHGVCMNNHILNLCLPGVWELVCHSHVFLQLPGNNLGRFTSLNQCQSSIHCNRNYKPLQCLCGG